VPDGGEPLSAEPAEAVLRVPYDPEQMLKDAGTDALGAMLGLSPVSYLTGMEQS
jgi:hypothetical protein